MKKIFTLLLLLLGSQSLFSQTIYHVQPSGMDDKDGLSWATAFKTVQQALSAAASGSQIWVAAGTYYPDEGPGQDNDKRISTFELKDGVALYGGFAGTETELSERKWANNEAILSGDLSQDDTPNWGNSDDNAYHVVSSGSDVTRSTILDGFTLTAGHAAFPYPNGGGMKTEKSSPTIRNCRFTGNHANDRGGGIFNGEPLFTYGQHAPLIINCAFTGNKADYGGAIYNSWSDAAIINCSFYGNHANGQGGVICSNNYDAIISITNCILWGNTPNQAEGYYSISYSIVQGGWPGNLNTDPLFVNAAGGDLRVQYGSPAINAGNDAAVPATVTTDLDGHPRKQGLHVDMGAYEFVSTGGDHPPGPYKPLILVCPDSITLESAAEACGAFIDFDAAQLASVDGGTPPITVTYSPASGNPLPVGENTITVTATDSTGETKTCSFMVTVEDATPPILGCPAVAGIFLLEGQPLIKATDPGACTYTIQGTELDAQATDNCPAPLVYSYSFSGATNTTEAVVSHTLSGVVLNQGLTTVTWMVQDAAGNSSSCHFDVLVADKTAPEITNVSVSTPALYPPNHQMQDITVRYQATDNCEVAATTLSVTSNEIPNALGSGHTSSDWQVVDNHHLKLRAERSGKGTDRIYTIIISAKDAAGNESTATTTVTVPHDKGVPVTSAHALNSKEVSSVVITAVPNPAAEGFSLTMQGPSDLPLSIKVMDGAGRMIEQKDRIAANGTLYIGSSYRPGTYYLQVVQGSAVHTIKLVKQTR